MKFAVVGATGLVGRKVVELLIKKNIANKENLFLFASKKSADKIIEIENNFFKVKELKIENISNFDFAFFCAGSKVSIDYANVFAKKGCVVIDNSNAFRRKKNTPLVVPEINFDVIKNKKIISNPNCSTIGASLVLYPLSKKYSIKRVIITTFQAVSGAGNNGIKDLKNNTTNKFIYPINNNLIPHIDIFLNNGYTLEEDKMNFEIRKILNNQNIKISTTCVRVPIENCHSESINIEFDKKPNIASIKKILNKAQGVVVYDNPQRNEYPMPVLANENYDVFVGRIRRDVSNKNAINLFISFDNVLKGASLNAVQILEKLLKLYK